MQDPWEQHYPTAAVVFVSKGTKKKLQKYILWSLPSWRCCSCDFRGSSRSRKPVRPPGPLSEVRPRTHPSACRHVLGVLLRKFSELIADDWPWPRLSSSLAPCSLCLLPSDRNTAPYGNPNLTCVYITLAPVTFYPPAREVYRGGGQRAEISPGPLSNVGVSMNRGIFRSGNCHVT